MRRSSKGKIPASPPRVIKNYKYAVYPREFPPPEFWEQARQMNALWNEMLDAREEVIAELKALFSEEATKQIETVADQAAAEKEPETAPRKRIRSERENALWREFERKLLEISVRSDWKQKLGNCSREYVLEKFRTASVAVFRKKGTLRRKHSFLTRVVIPYRFTQGGWKIKRLFADGSKKLHIDPLPEEIFSSNDWQSRRARMTTGFYGYGIDKRPLRLRILLHRPLPALGLIKTSNLLGEYDSLTRNWTWHLLITCQTEPAEEVKLFKPAAAIDFGFRRMGDYLRVGYVMDTAGNQYELKLPIIEQPSRRLLNALRVVNDARERKKLPRLSSEEFYPISLFDVQSWQSKRDLAAKETRERIKESLKEVDREQGDSFSDEINEILKGLNLIRRTGLLKLWRLTALAPAQTETSRLREPLVEWQEKDLENLKKIRTTRTYLFNKRNKAYENIALWLKSNFSHIIFDQNFSLRAIAEAAPKMSMKSKNAAMKAGAKYRVFAALYFLQQKIKDHDSNGWLIKVDVSHPGSFCYRCGSLCEATQKLQTICPNGHEADQDFQACFNILQRLPGELIFDRNQSRLEIPAHLEKFIVPILASEKKIR